MTVSQKDYQAQVTAGLGATDDNAVLSLSPEDMGVEEGAGQAQVEPTTEPEVDVPEDTAGVEGTETNAETVYSKEQVQAIVRSRVANYQKKLDKLNQADSAVERIAEVSGLSKEQLITRLNSMSDAEQAKILGIPPEQVAHVRATRAAQMESDKQIKKLNRELELTQLKADKQYSDIDLFMDDVLAKVEDHPSLSLKDAYTLVKGELGITAKVRDAEQRVLNSQAIAKQKKAANPVGAAQDAPQKMSQAVLSGAKTVGMDPTQYAAFQQIDNLDAYRAFKKAQKGGS